MGSEEEFKQVCVLVICVGTNGKQGLQKRQKGKRLFALLLSNEAWRHHPCNE
jgi:hypothetical protein